MKTRGLVVLGLVLLGCPEERVGPGEATPIAPTAPRGPPPPNVRPAVPEPAPVVKEAPRPPPVPTTPVGLMRVKVGDSAEFSWRRVGDAALDQADAQKVLAAVQGQGGANLDRIKAMTSGMKQKPSYQTGTVVVTRTQPEVPFTFTVDLKQGKEVETRAYAYTKDIPLHEVTFHTDPADPRVKEKAGGVETMVVTKESRKLAPELDALAIAGGLVSNKPADEFVGVVSVELLKFGPSKATAAPLAPKAVDSFETPIGIAMQAISKLGVIDLDEKARNDAALMEELGKVATPCVKSAKPKSGLLGGSIVGGKIEHLTWNDGPAGAAFEKCIRAATKKLKLPKEETVIKVGLPRAP